MIDLMPENSNENPNLGNLGVPDCPECGDQNAVQLSTDEWVCQSDGCHEVFTCE
jgi:hypothetical protein